MKWNWELSAWPEFVWDRPALAELEQRFALHAGVFIGVVTHLGPDDREQVRVQAMRSEALTTSEIEGEILDRASLQSSICRQLGLPGDGRRERPAEQGIAEMTVDAYRSFDAPLDRPRLFDWHRMLMRGRRDLQDVGGYRTIEEPMQIVSDRLDEPKVHFEAPPADRVPGEMARFVDWFNSSRSELSPLARAGVAHLWFESIHPFEDGNGRIGRTISEKALAQGVGQPTLIALSATILARRKAYYDSLERGSRRLDITEWLIWFGETACEAQERTNALIEFLAAKGRMMSTLAGKLNARQEKALVRMFQEGPEGFKGGLSAGNYMKITGASSATTTRDLVGLVELGALERRGEGRYARYRVRV